MACSNGCKVSHRGNAPSSWETRSVQSKRGIVRGRETFPVVVCHARDRDAVREIDRSPKGGSPRAVPAQCIWKAARKSVPGVVYEAAALKRPKCNFWNCVGQGGHSKDSGHRIARLKDPIRFNVDQASVGVVAGIPDDREVAIYVCGRGRRAGDEGGKPRYRTCNGRSGEYSESGGCDCQKPNEFTHSESLQ